MLSNPRLLLAVNKLGMPKLGRRSAWLCAMSARTPGLRVPLKAWCWGTPIMRLMRRAAAISRTLAVADAGMGVLKASLHGYLARTAVWH